MNEIRNDNLTGTLLDGRYELQEVIGEGGMAVVYKAMDNRLNRLVAVKIMRDEMAADEEFKRRFCAESQAVAMLSHSNIVAVYDVSQSEEREYIVMELIEGITLKQYLEKKGAIGWRETVHFSKQIARALAHAHERCIIHRDIKPQNIMLLRDGTIKVADFGIAALENEATESNGQAIGSIHYIAPEQAKGELPNARSDVYSLGIVMYEMLTGKQPYTGETIAEIAFKHIEANPVPPHEIVSDFPPELETIIMKAMNPNVSDRYGSAEELLSDLDVFTHQQVEAEEKAAAEVPEVAPIHTTGELSRAHFVQQRRKSGKVGFLEGTFLTLTAALLLFGFLWKFWLSDVFSGTVNVTVTAFTGQQINRVLSDPEYNEQYAFELVYVQSDSAEPGIVLAQEPAAGRVVSRGKERITVKLSVYNGDEFHSVPEVKGMDYREARTVMENLGYVVEVNNDVSETVPKDCVINTSPAAGEKAIAGSTVYLSVSTGSSVSFVQVPLLIGLTEEAAVAKLNSSNLSYGGSIPVESSAEIGIVVAQSVDAFTEIEEHGKIILSISAGVG